MSTESKPDPSACCTGPDPAAVCTLSSESREQRLVWVRQEILPHAVTSERRRDSIAVELVDSPGLAARLDRLVALERECCEGIVFAHARTSTPGRRRLEICGIDPNASIFATVPEKADETPRSVARLAKSAGIGALFSLLVCCALPISAAALLGAAAVAPFASLDDPWVIGGGAVLAGGAAFAWLGRGRVT